MQLILPNCDVLCLFNCVDSDIWKPILHWLSIDTERRVVVFYEKKTLQHPQILTCGRDRQSIMNLAKKHVFLRFDYLKQDEKDPLLFSEVEEVIAEFFLYASDFRLKGVDRLQNLLRNSLLFPKAFSASDLFGSFNRIPAIICGAGPSLDKQISCLQLLKEKAIFFAGGAALTRLSQLGIQPHFSAIMDPHPPREIDKQHGGHETPCFFQSRAHFEKINALQGPLLWTPGCGNEFFEEDRFDGGGNVSTYLTAIACYLGCSPIVLVGVDLCGDQKQLYSGFLDESTENLVQTSSGLNTKRDWLVAARFLSEFAKKHPEAEWINVSEGTELIGYQAMRLEDVSFTSQFDIRGRIHSALFNLSKGVIRKYERKEIFESLERVSNLCRQLIQELERHFPNIPDRDYGYTVLEIEMEREEAYFHFVKPVWDVWCPILARSIPQELRNKQIGLKLNKWLFVKGICDDARKV